MRGDKNVYRVEETHKIKVKRLQELQFHQVNGIWELKLSRPDSHLLYHKGKIEIYSPSVNTLLHICKKLGLELTEITIEHLVDIEGDNDSISFRRWGTLQGYS